MCTRKGFVLSCHTAIKLLSCGSVASRDTKFEMGHHMVELLCAAGLYSSFGKLMQYLISLTASNIGLFIKFFELKSKFSLLNISLQMDIKITGLEVNICLPNVYNS